MTADSFHQTEPADEMLRAGALSPSGEGLSDNDLPGMWERADFVGGQEEVRGPDWKRPSGARVDADAKQLLTMRISYERAGRCFWHLDCKVQRHAPPMKIERDDNEIRQTLLRCTACNLAGWYPHGSVGEVCCAPEAAAGVREERKPFRLDPPPIYDEHYAATQDDAGADSSRATAK